MPSLSEIPISSFSSPISCEAVLIASAISFCVAGSWASVSAGVLTAVSLMSMDSWTVSFSLLLFSIMSLMLSSELSFSASTLSMMSWMVSTLSLSSAFGVSFVSSSVRTSSISFSSELSCSCFLRMLSLISVVSSASVWILWDSFSLSVSFLFDSLMSSSIVNKSFNSCFSLFWSLLDVIISIWFWVIGSWNLLTSFS